MNSLSSSAYIIFKWRVIALFSRSIGAGLVVFIGSWWVLRPYISWVFPWKWAKINFQLASISSAGNFTDQFQAFIEKSLLTRYTGFEQLGLYTHSQQYNTAFETVMKSITRSVWPVTLQESVDPESEFEKTGKVWTVVHVGFSAIGLFFASLGGYFIGILTHHKFTQAYVFAALWVVMILFNTSGRAQLGGLYSSGRVKFVAVLTSVTMVISILFLFLLIPRYGTIGAMISVIGQQ